MVRSTVVMIGDRLHDDTPANMTLLMQVARDYPQVGSRCLVCVPYGMP
jgi:hypothetical protein